MANHVDLMEGLPSGSRSFRVTMHTSAGGTYTLNLHGGAPSQNNLIEHIAEKLSAASISRSGLLTWSAHDGGMVISADAVVAVNVAPLS